MPGADSTLIDLTVTRRALAVYNRQRVVGYDASGYPIRGEARVTNPLDPLYWTESNDLPARTYEITGVTATQQMVNAVAQRLLMERSYYEEEVEIVGSPIPLISDRDVVRAAGAGVDDSYLVDSLDMALGQGTMTARSKKVRSLSPA